MTIFDTFHTLNVDDISSEPRMELDSHGNMSVVGHHAYVFSDTGQTVDINAYNLKYKAMQIHIVDAAMQYYYPCSGQTYVIVIRNAMRVLSMNYHLIPPSILREAGLRVSDTTNIHSYCWNIRYAKLTVLDHESKNNSKY